MKKFNGIPPYRETRNYVCRILSLAGLQIAAHSPSRVASSLSNPEDRLRHRQLLPRLTVPASPPFATASQGAWYIIRRLPIGR